MTERDKTILDPTRTRLGFGDGKHVEQPLVENTVVLDRYLIESVLGAGAMGTVYRGSDIKTGHGVAIKVMHAHLGHEPTLVARFRREGQVAARMHHENVVGVLDVGSHARSPVMVLELALGPTLRDVMDAPLTVDRIIRLLSGILHGLDHAHQAGLVHRDLKPENVIVEHRPDGTDLPRIVDFGIAALTEPDDTPGGGKLTEAGVVVGTPMYMAPEQAKGESIDHRVDLFALGVTLYEMLVGEPPFSGSVREVVLANINKDPPAIANVDPNLEWFTRKLMARDRERRVASARDALEVLALIEHDPAAAAAALGRHDIAKASAVIALPDDPALR